MNLRTTLFITLLSTFGFTALFSQYQIGLVPRVSPDKSLSHKLGFTDITVTYGSSKVNGRKIWGELEPYDEVWRAGANDATTLELSDPVTIMNKTVPAGKYSLFIIPKEKGPWTVILNKEAKQWGSFRYNDSLDLVRFKVPIKTTEQFAEHLSYDINSLSYDDAVLSFRWAKIGFDLPIKGDYVTKLKHIHEELLAEITADRKWVTYLQIAQLFAYEEIESDLAMNYLDQAETLFNSEGGKWKDNEKYFMGHIYFVRALVYQNLNENSKAKQAIQDCINISEDKGYYNRKKAMIDEVLADLD